jgi:REP element-mobilizing transposase RayT
LSPQSVAIARKLRIEFESARYHVINRGNYRSDVFKASGATDSFLETLEEAVEKYGWGLFEYVLMRNHDHLAIAKTLNDELAVHSPGLTARLDRRSASSRRVYLSRRT